MNASLVPAAVRCNLIAPNKKSLLQHLSTIASTAHGVSATLVLDRLLERERLGSTGFGNGIALPHGKIDGIDHVIAVCVHLSQPIDFEAIDDLPVDLVYMLLSPLDSGADHLKALASASRLMRDGGFVEKLRGAATDDALYALFESQTALS